ncbi:MULTISPECIES: 2'-5' RNA ligase family protein [Saliphagus]|uniref:2'-5' RNA ligase family protein n=1 Tax=Saliphagus infecundisoli TaxID=1849069 RepID=A0ABD5QBJ3_9EURY|nr:MULTISPECIES: 2'-5' RNA ligase family protein [Saliphagus]
MYSVNAPVPGRVRELASRLYPRLVGFETVRETHSLLVKRLATDEDRPVSALGRRVHRALEGAPAVEARITGIDCFADPPLGSAPVVYLAVESPGLEAIHADLADVFDPVAGLEGDDYVPHVTLARGGDPEAARRLADRSIEPVTWTVGELEFWDGTYELPVSSVSLPA